MIETKSTCPYCGVGCGVIIASEGDQITGESIVGVRGDPDHPANFGRLCTKGSTLHLTASASASVTQQTRLLQADAAPDAGGTGPARGLGRGAEPGQRQICQHHHRARP